MPKNKLFILLLNYRQPELTLSCQNNLLKSDLPRDSHFIIIDNSPQHSHQFLKKNLQKNTILIDSGKNLGFAAGNNLGIKAALEKGATHLMIINPDVTVPQKLFNPLFNQLNQDHQIGIIAPAHRHGKKLTLGGKLNLLTATPKHQTVDKSRKKTTYHDFVSFACVLIKKEVFEKIGLLDERYFMYLEDVDFCIRAKEKSYKIASVPLVVVDHLVSSSFSFPVKKLKYLIPSHFRFIINNLHGINKLTALVYQSLHYPYLYLLWTYHHWRYRPISTT